MFPALKSFKFAFKALKTNITRSLLAVLGVLIGIAAVIIVMSSGESLKSFILGQLDMFGSDTIEVEIKVPNVSQTSTENVGGMVSGVSITTFKNKDIEAMRKIENIEAMYGATMGQDLVSYKNTIKKIMMFVTEADFTKVDTSKVENGRFFTEQEDKTLKQVAVLGTKIKDKLFGDNDPIGKNIKIGKLKFKVIGVLQPRGTIAFFDMDDFIYIPLRTYQKKIAGVDYLMFSFAKVKDVNRIEETAAEMTYVMRQQHNITDPNKDDFAVISMQEATEMLDTVIDGIVILLTALVIISLIVGGVGIMNIMYVSVSERTFEIGLRKAVGATSNNIMWQFLWEAVIITLLGGIIGVIVGISTSYAISRFATLQGFEQDFIVPINSIIIAFGFSTTVGLIFGLYPAKKAASLDPIEALVHE